MKHVKGIIFDLDGTLLDTLEDLTDAMNHVLSVHCLPQHSLEDVRGFVGNGIDILVRRALPEGYTEELFSEALEEFKAYYKVHCNDKTKPYEGILPMLKVLKEKGYKMAIVSNKADFAVKELNEIYFSSYISVAVGACEGRQKKPAPDAVFAAVEELKLQPEQCIYVGDSQVDVATAQNSGLPCIAVEWGFRDRQKLKEAGAEHIISSPEEILEKYLL